MRARHRRRPLLEGRAAVAEYVRGAFKGIPDLHLEKLEEWQNGGGTVDAPGQPALAPTHGRIYLLGMDRSELRGGRLDRHQIFWDVIELGRTIGLFPPRGSRMENVTRRLQPLTARRVRRHG